MIVQQTRWNFFAFAYHHVLAHGQISTMQKATQSDMCGFPNLKMHSALYSHSWQQQNLVFVQRYFTEKSWTSTNRMQSETQHTRTYLKLFITQKSENKFLYLATNMFFLQEEQIAENHHLNVQENGSSGVPRWAVSNLQPFWTELSDLYRQEF